MKLFDFDGPLMMLLRKLWAIVGTGILFLLLCVPVVTAGLSFTALYTVADRNLKNNRGYVFSVFFGAVKRNWRQALPAGTVLAALLFVFETDVRILKAFLESGNAVGNMYVLIRIFQILLTVYAVWVFAQIAVYENRLKQILKNALVLMIRHLGASLILLLLLVFTAAVVYVMPVAVLFMPVLAVWMMTAVLDKVFQKYQ